MKTVSARHVLAVFVLGALVRFALLRIPRLWYDEATVGITGLAVLRGELPVYFFGQPFMGTLGDAYLAASLYVIFGTSVCTLKALAVVLSLAWLALVVRLAWDGFGPRAAWLTALVFVVPPDYLLHWSHEGRPHYPLSMVLGSLALLLALRAPVAPPDRALVHFGLVGGILGLAFWTNFLSVVFVPAVGILALRRGIRLPLRGAVAGVPAFVLGSLPHWLYAVAHGTVVPPAGGRIRWVEFAAHLRWAAGRSWPTLAGVPAERHGVGAVLVTVGLAAIYVAAAVAGVRAIHRGKPAVRAVALACLVLAATSLATTIGTEYGRFLEDDPRYLLPLYTALPPLLGLWLSRLPGWAATGLAASLLLVHAAGGMGGEFGILTPRGAAAAQALNQAQLDAVAALERQGLTRLYSADFGMRVLTFLSRERVIFANPYEEIYPPYVLAVAGAERPAWWTSGRDPAFEANLAALGVRFAYRPVSALGGAYVDFSVPVQPLRELDPSRFTVTASHAGHTAGWAADRDAATLWSTGRPKRGGEWLQVDLGRVEPVALVRWLPGTYQEVPNGLTLELSRDGSAWQKVIDLPGYMGPLYWSAGVPMRHVRSGRVELRMPPTPARYLRITQLGANAIWPWTVRELFVYAAAGEPAAPASPVDGVALARQIRAAGVTRLYADHGWGSRAALADPAIRIMPANLALDAYNFAGSARDLLPPLRWTPDTGVLLEAADAAGFAAVARASGLAYAGQAIGDLRLFTYAPPPSRSGVPLPLGSVTVSASRQPERARLAADGDPKTRWATGHPQTPGDWVRIDLATPRVVRAVRLYTANPTDAARGLALEGSEDGTTWRPIVATLVTESPLRWAGIGVLRDGVEAQRFEFSPVRLTALRLTLTRGDPVFDWSIHELTVYAAE